MSRTRGRISSTDGVFYEQEFGAVSVQHLDGAQLCRK